MKNLRIFMSVTLIVLIGAGFYACKKDEQWRQDEEQRQLKNFNPVEGMLVLGEEINDPYQFENMRKAFLNLLAEGINPPHADALQPSHVYVRFLPENEDIWQELKQDTSLILYDFPLNYDIVEHGLYYHDPSLPEDAITWQYSVVPVDYDLPTSIPHEIIYFAYIPDIDIKDEAQRVYNEALTDEAYRIAGAIDDADGDDGTVAPIEKAKTQKAKATIWIPSGTITVYDNVLNRQIPVQQAEVHARYGVHIERALTNNNGYFSTGSFKYKVNYSIKWERGVYDIRDGGLLQAWYNGPKQKGSWNLDIYSGKSIMYATMHRAAYKQFYGDNLGIHRPTIPGRKTKLCYIDKNGIGGVFWGNVGGGVLPDIKIWGKENGVYKTTQYIFGATTHELGHQSHLQFIGNIQFWQTAKLIYESWAEVVEWALTNDEYHKLGNKYNDSDAKDYNHILTIGSRGAQTWTKSSFNWEYSPIFVDLIDNYNQRLYYGNSCPNDNVTGYTISYIQTRILGWSYGLHSLYNTVQNNRISGVSYNDVEQLFALYW